MISEVGVDMENGTKPIWSVVGKMLILKTHKEVILRRTVD